MRGIKDPEHLLRLKGCPPALLIAVVFNGELKLS